VKSAKDQSDQKEVSLIGGGFYALEKVKTRSKKGFYTSEEGFNASEGVQCIGRGFLEAK